MHLPRVRTCVALGLWVLVPALAASAGCRTATQIVVEVQSDLCARIHSTDVTVAGDEIALATKTISDASRSGCAAAPQVGKVVLVPDGADDMEVVLRVVTGLDKPASTCREGDEGCIFARRRARFAPNEIVQVSVVMSLACQRVVCAAGESCDPTTGMCGPITSGAGGSADGGNTPAPEAGAEDGGGGQGDGGACTSAGCTFECTAPGECTKPACTPGLPCVIHCRGDGACVDIDCGQASSCEVTCEVEHACKGKGGVQCGTASKCTVECRSQRACDTKIGCSCGDCSVRCTADKCDSRDVFCCDEACSYPSGFKCQGTCD